MTVLQVDRLKGAFLPKPKDPPLVWPSAAVGVPSLKIKLRQLSPCRPVVPLSMMARAWYGWLV